MTLDSINENKRVKITTKGIGVRILPKKPGMNKIGTKATAVVITAKVTGIATACAPAIEDSTLGPSFWKWENTLSPTTMASSTTIPRTIMNPKSEIRLMDTSAKGSIMKAPRKEMGIPRVTHTANEGRRNRVRAVRTNTRPITPFSISMFRRPFK